MKWLLMLVCLSIGACSVEPYKTHGFYDNPESATARHEIVAIDSTIRQLHNEYAKASNAISVNDAEKVYLQRFEEDLLNKREVICEQELNGSACNQKKELNESASNQQRLSNLPLLYWADPAK
jgi:CRISPR/Cas system CMR subunit Cmr4 (Cas7 group RAMP superfamily)